MKKNLYIITDFDHTITSIDSKSSWNILDNKKIMKVKDIKLCENLQKYYLPIENDEKISLNEKEKIIKKWYDNHLNIFIKNKIKEEAVNKISSDKNCMTLRKGAKEFLKYAHEEEIPVIIVSAGISNTIENFLKVNNCLYNNVYIISNIIKYKDGIIKGFRSEIINSLNKNKISFPAKIEEITKNKENVIVLGDNISDTLITPKNKNCIKIGFIIKKEGNKQYFDLIYDEDSSLEEIIQLIETTN